MTTATMPKFEADEEKRIFTLDGRRIPTPSDVLKDQGLMPTFIPEQYKRRGQFYHSLTQFFDEGDYSEAEAERLGLAGFVRSWAACKKAENFEVVEMERRRFDPVYGFCARPDRLLRSSKYPGFIVGDIKSPNEYDYVRYQLGAQETIYRASKEFGDSFLRCAIHLQEDGLPAEVRWYEDDSDVDIFLALLAATQTRLKHGIIAWGSNGLESTAR